MRLIDRIGKSEARSAWGTGLNLEALASLIYDGQTYPLTGRGQLPGAPYIEPSSALGTYASAIHSRHPIVSAAVVARMLLVSQMHFRWRPYDSPGELTSSRELAGLRTPGGMPRPQFLSTLEMHDSYAGNAFVYRNPVSGRYSILNPDRTTILYGVEGPADQPFERHVLAYLYRDTDTSDPVMLPAETVAHWVTEPDPVCWWRGQSWVTSVVREVAADNQASDHQANFYRNAATPQLAIAFDASLTAEQIKTYAALIEEKHEGAANAYKTLVLGGGADAKVIGAGLDKLDMRGSKNGFDTRIALRSRVPAPILQISEGLGGSALNSGNYSAARRMWADGWFVPAADSLCAALDVVVPSPGGDRELTYDPARIVFLQEDRKDEADIHAANAQAMRSLVEAGYEANSVTEAIVAGDLSRLRHSGLFSVQLQPAGTETTPVT